MANATLTVPCRQCGQEMPAERLTRAGIAYCVPCNAPSLKTSREVRERAPQYETAVFEAGGKL